MNELGGRLVILAGPSGVGKSPLDKALARIHPDLHGRLQKVVLCNDRAPRPGEVDGKDYHFRTRAQIEALRTSQRHAVIEVRGDLQALDLDELSSLLSRGDAFFEGNPFVGRLLISHPRLADVNRLSVFLSPLSREEIQYFSAPDRNVSLPGLVTDIMRRKLLRRTRRQKGELSLKDLENIERRAGSAYQELRDACHFQHVIPNHDGEESEHWDAWNHPIGDAGRALRAFAALLRGESTALVEKWEPDLLPVPARPG